MKSLAYIEAASVIALWLALSLAYLALWLALSLAYLMARGALRFVARLWRRY